MGGWTYPKNDKAIFDGHVHDKNGKLITEADLSAVAEDILPDADNIRDIGSNLKRWAAIFAVLMFVTTLTIGSVVITGIDRVLVFDNVTDVNFTMANLTTIDHIWARNWTNVTTDQFDEFIAADCAAGDVMVGVEPNGSITCVVDAIGAVAGTNLSNQHLNTTNNVSFVRGNFTSDLFTNGRNVTNFAYNQTVLDTDTTINSTADAFDHRVGGNASMNTANQSRLCLDPDCIAMIYSNGSDIIIRST